MSKTADWPYYTFGPTDQGIRLSGLGGLNDTPTPPPPDPVGGTGTGGSDPTGGDSRGITLVGPPGFWDIPVPEITPVDPRNPGLPPPRVPPPGSAYGFSDDGVSLDVDQFLQRSRDFWNASSKVFEDNGPRPITPKFDTTTKIPPPIDPIVKGDLWHQHQPSGQGDNDPCSSKNKISDKVKLPQPSPTGGANNDLYSDHTFDDKMSKDPELDKQWKQVKTEWGLRDAFAGESAEDIKNQFKSDTEDPPPPAKPLTPEQKIQQLIQRELQPYHNSDFSVSDELKQVLESLIANPDDPSIDWGSLPDFLDALANQDATQLQMEMMLKLLNDRPGQPKIASGKAPTIKIMSGLGFPCPDDQDKYNALTSKDKPARADTLKKSKQLLGGGGRITRGSGRTKLAREVDATTVVMQEYIDVGDGLRTPVIPYPAPGPGPINPLISPITLDWFHPGNLLHGPLPPPRIPSPSDRDASMVVGNQFTLPVITPLPIDISGAIDDALQALQPNVPNQIISFFNRIAVIAAMLSNDPNVATDALDALMGEDDAQLEQTLGALDSFFTIFKPGSYVPPSDQADYDKLLKAYNDLEAKYYKKHHKYYP